MAIPQQDLVMKVNEFWKRHKSNCALDTIWYRSCPIYHPPSPLTYCKCNLDVKSNDLFFFSSFFPKYNIMWICVNFNSIKICNIGSEIPWWPHVQIIKNSLVIKSASFFYTYIGIQKYYTYGSHIRMFCNFFSYDISLSFFYQHIQINLIHFNVFMLSQHLDLKIIYLFFYWWMFWLPAIFHYEKQCYNEHSCMYHFVSVRQHIFRLSYLR